MKTINCFIIKILIFVAFSGTLSAKPTVSIKFATLAPEGSTWMNVMRKLNDEIREVTSGEVEFKIYPGGVQGDEQDIIRKMRYGQIHSAGFTGNGLGEILPEIRVLELPFLFNSQDEIDYITKTYYDQFDKSFREKGFVLLGWTEVGYVYFFSNIPINSLKDVKGVRVWTWEGDPLAQSMFEAMNISPFPLSVTEVLTALQTGMIDAVYTTPLAAVTMQWFTRVEYMNSFPLTNATGAVLMTSAQFEKIPEEYRDVVRSICRQRLAELTQLSRKDNELSIKELEEAGITITPALNEAALDEFQKVGKDVQLNLSGELYSQELLNSIVNSLDTYRNFEE